MFNAPTPLERLVLVHGVTSVKSWGIDTDNIFGHRCVTTEKLKFHQHRLQISSVLLLSGRNLLGPIPVFHKGPPTN